MNTINYTETILESLTPINMTGLQVWPNFDGSEVTVWYQSYSPNTNKSRDERYTFAISREVYLIISELVMDGQFAIALDCLKDNIDSVDLIVTI